MDLGTFLFMLGLAYGTGVLWYDLVPGELSERPWRVAAYPFVAMALAEAFLPIGPMFGGLHVGTAFVAALVGVVVDWAVTRVRHPASIPSPELRPMHA